MGKLTFNEIAKGRIKEHRNVVISEVYNRRNECIGYSISEQLIVHEEEKELRMFLKGGLGIVKKEGLLQLKEVVDTACIKAGLMKEHKEQLEYEEESNKKL